MYVLYNFSLLISTTVKEDLTLCNLVEIYEQFLPHGATLQNILNSHHCDTQKSKMYNHICLYMKCINVLDGEIKFFVYKPHLCIRCAVIIWGGGGFL
jgi:hypothetical protein